MTRYSLLAAAIAVATATTAFAATTAGAGSAMYGRMSLDANHDGVIDRGEIAAHPRMAGKFDQLDRNHDGRLAADELPHWKGRHGGGRGHHGDLSKLDADGDGRIAQAELAGNPRLAPNFAAMDLNRDGYLVRSEVRSYRQRMRPQRMAERTKRFDERFAAADLDRDGKLSRVEVSEKMPRLAKGFAWMDDNRDGFLGREELLPARNR